MINFSGGIRDKFKLIRRDRLLQLNLIAILLFLALPYYLFQGKLYVGGDDTRLLYSYPFDFLKNVAFYSWYNFSSIGMNVPNQFSLPFLTMWSVLGQFVPRIQLDYLSFSLPLILGLIYFQKIVKEMFKLTEKNFLEIYVGSLCFILSPILIINQLFIFLTTVWLLGVMPAMGYYLIKYLREPDFSNIYKSMWISFLLASALLSVPWVLGFIMPLFFGVSFLVFVTKRKKIYTGIKRGIVFTSVIMTSHAFWILGFMTTYIGLDKSSAAVKFTSKDFLSTFALTVNGTAIGNIFYPMLNLFHRNIAVNFGWKLSSDFMHFYDKTFFLNLALIILIIFGAIHYKALHKEGRKLYTVVLISLIFSLYFFTVNIGPLKDLFLQFGKLPGFVMFRNFYDKFAPGFVFLYSLLITMGLVIVRIKYPKKIALVSIAIIVLILVNFIPVKSTVTSALWTTNDTGKQINFSAEYLSFMDKIGHNVSSSNNILSIPFGTASYTVVKDADSDNVYAGVSPVKIFSGVNDFSGDLSFSVTASGEDINGLIIDRKYSEIARVLYRHNVNYLLLTKNIPSEVLHSYVFNYDSVKKQDDKFINSLASKKIMTSENGNYALYLVKNKNILINSPNTKFKKINQVTYKIRIENIKKNQILKFNDTFNGGWKIFPASESDFGKCQILINTNGTTECKAKFNFFSVGELSNLWKKPLFQNSHGSFNNYGNQWIVNYEEIRGLGSSNYEQNPDNSLNINMVLYFRPQLYFYYGSLISLFVIFLSTIYYLKTRKKRE